MVEVVIATGVFAFAVAGVLMLMPQLTRQATAANEAMSAQQLGDGIRVEMRRLAGAGFDAFAQRVPLAGAMEGYRLVATREGARVSVEASGGTVSADEAFFLVELWRFAEGPLAFVPGQSGALAVEVRVSWPYRRTGALEEVALADRESVSFAVAINR